MLGVAFLTRFCFISGRHTSCQPAARRIVLFPLTFYFCFLFVFASACRAGGEWSWNCDWDWAWPRLAFGLSGTLFDDAFRDFFALECLIFISRILYRSFSFLLRLFLQRFLCLFSMPSHVRLLFVWPKLFLLWLSKQRFWNMVAKVTPCLPACSGCSRSFGGFAKVDSENQYLFESKVRIGTIRRLQYHHL